MEVKTTAPYNLQLIDILTSVRCLLGACQMQKVEVDSGYFIASKGQLTKLLCGPYMSLPYTAGDYIHCRIAIHSSHDSSAFSLVRKGERLSQRCNGAMSKYIHSHTPSCKAESAGVFIPIDS